MNIKIVGDNNYLGDLKEEFFKNRGIDNYMDFIKLKGFEQTDPFAFKNMKEAVRIITEKSGLNVGIVYDSDVDGVASGTILYNYLSTYCDHNLKISIHRKKTHGINMEELHEDGIIGWADVLIVPDAGSSDFAQHDGLLNGYNIRTIVLDHHQCDLGYSETATVVNNQLDNISTDLTGSAMCYKFTQALDIVLDECGADDFLDLVAIGLIGDMANVKDYEVQSLIRSGIKSFNNEFIKTVIKNDFNIKSDGLTSTTLAFSIIPMINACTRVAEFDEMKFIIDAMGNVGTDRVFEYTFQRGKNKGKTIEENIYEYAHRVASKCRARQNRNVEKVLLGSKRPLKQGILSKMEEVNLVTDDTKIIVLDISDYEEVAGLSGLLANKIMYSFNKPTLVLSNVNGGYAGSGRGEQISFLRKRLEESNLVKSALGHEPAFGVKLLKDATIEDISTSLNEYFKDEDTEAQYVVDFNIPYDELEDYLIEDLANLEEFFGNGLKAPIVYTNEIIVEVSSIETGKNGNLLKFVHNDIEFVKFKLKASDVEKLVPWQDKVCYNIVSQPSINIFKGKRTVQLVIKDIELVPLDDEQIEKTEDIDWSNKDEEFEW